MSSSRIESQPVLLLKTKSTPADHYQELFSVPRDGFTFAPEFVPVLQHQFLDDGLQRFRELLQGKKISNREDAEYGGLIFTSQRAVEAFAKLVEEGKGIYILYMFLSILFSHRAVHWHTIHFSYWPRHM
jgi:uroporphyrinogen-III synthase